MTWAQAVQGLPWAVILALALWWLRDRRKDRAAAAVAEGTVPADIAVKDIGAQDARLVYAIKAFDAERVSLQRQINDRDREMSRKDTVNRALTAELTEAQTVIAGLRVRVEELQARLDDALRDLNGVRQELVRFADQHNERGQK